MRRCAEGWRPHNLILSLVAVVFTLIFVCLTDSWLPEYFIHAMQHYATAPAVAGAGGFCRFMIAAVFLYVITLAACGVLTALIFRTGCRMVWRLAGG